MSNAIYYAISIVFGLAFVALAIFAVVVLIKGFMTGRVPVNGRLVDVRRAPVVFIAIMAAFAGLAWYLLSALFTP